MKRLPLNSFALGLFFALASAAFGYRQPDHCHDLPNFDKRQPHAQQDKELRAKKDAAVGQIKAKLPKAKVDFDATTGSAKFVRAGQGFLTGPGGKGRGISAKAAAGIAPNDPHRAAKTFLREHRELFGHGDEVLAGAVIKREFVSTHNQLKTVVWEQQLDGIPVFDGLLIAHTTGKGELVNLSSQMLPEAARAADRGVKNRAVVQAAPHFSARKAVKVAAESVEEELSENEIIPQAGDAVGPQKKQKFKSASLPGDTEARLIWLPVAPDQMKLCWEILLTSGSRAEMFRLLVDSETGQVWLRHNLTAYLSTASYRVFDSDSPSPFSPGHTTTNSGQPAIVSRPLITVGALNTNASPNGWINDGGNETLGNNVAAHLDKNADNQPDLPRPQGSPNRVFDFPVDLAQAPGSYSDASVVQLFYWCNWMHDKLYELGFTEAAGSFQTDNFGRGGLGNDADVADAQDNGGFNNANFATPPDGSAPRLQMFIFTGPNPRRDSGFDTEVLLHEYAHGLSNRRVGGGAGLTALQSTGLGEGWSDFYALALLSQASDDPNAAYAFAGYVAYLLSPTFDQNYYFGIRRYPYSTDLTKNPLTFKDIDPTQASSHPSVPRSPVAGAGGASAVHNQGEVWCSALWDARANLIAKHGFTNGNQLILQLVTDGMNLAPPNPNFLQARDAILQADEINNGGANFWELWNAFAKRGMGFFATSPASTTTTGVSESFALPDNLAISPATGMTISGPVGGPFAPSQTSFDLANIGTNSLNWIVTPQADWLNLSSTNGSLSGGLGTNVAISVNLALATSLSAGIYTNTLTFSNETSGIIQTRRFVLRVGQPDHFTELFEANDADVAFQTFTFTPDGSDSFYRVCREAATNFPVNPSGGTTNALSDDSFVEVILPAGTNVSLYGAATNRFFINSNGSVSFDSGDSTFTETFASHFNRRRVSGWFRDLDPSTHGAVSWKLESNRVAVTYFRVPEFGTINTNNFQIELFFDGRVRLTFLRMDARNGLVGLSQGLGVPANFAESNFGGFPECAPLLQVTLPSGVTESDGLLTSAGKVSIASPLATNLTINLFSASSSQISVPESIVLWASATNAFFDLDLMDDALLNGTRAVNITATASGYLNGVQPLVIHDNETTTMTVSIPAEETEGNGTFAGSVTLETTADADIVVELISSDTSEVMVPGLVVVPAGQSSAGFNATIVDDALIDGDQLVTITTRVQNWPDGVAQMTLRDNEHTNLMVSLPASVREGNGNLASAGLVRISGMLSTNLTVTLASTVPGELTVPATVSISAGATAATFDLTVADDALLDGDQSVEVQASADGFNQGAASLTVTDDEKPLPPSHPFPLHFSTTNSVHVNLSWDPGLGEGLEQLSNGGFESGDLTGWTVTGATNGALVINNGSYNPASPDGPTAPFAGRFSVLAEQSGAGTLELRRDVAIPVASVVTLSWADRIRNFPHDFAANHQFRVEVRDTNNAMIAVLFCTKPGDLALAEWTERSVNLTSYAGQTVRLAFVVQANAAGLDVHLDNVSLRAATPPPTTYEVYFGTNAVPGVGEFLGSTTNTSWDLPTLSPFVTYYWQIIAQRLDSTPGPVWQFSTLPDLSISSASVAEGNSGVTNITLTVTLSAPSDQVVTVDFATTNGTAFAPGDYSATNGTVLFMPGETNKPVEIAIQGDTVFEEDEIFFVRLFNPVNAVIQTVQGTVTILNDDPLLEPIPNKTVNEGSALTFFAVAPVIDPQRIVITDFEAFSTNAINGTVMFREPRNSGSTAPFLDASPNSAVITDAFPAGISGERVLKASWSFTSSPSAWLRFTTFSTANLPNPTVDFGQVLSFDIYTDRALKVGLGLRETSTTNAIGENGGGTGPIEFVGVPAKNGSTPDPSRTVAAGSWQTLSFNLPIEPVSSFTGNGVLESTTGKGVLEHLALVPADGSGTYNIYLDNFAVIASNVLVFSLEGAPAGASIDPSTGRFTWTPTEAQGPGVYPMTIRVTDNRFDPPLTDAKNFSVTVNEVNTAPTLAAIANRTIDEGTLMSVTNSAFDSDLPANTLTFSLVTAPAGVSVHPVTGVITWTPAEAQGPSTNTIVVQVTDNGVPPLSAQRTFFVVVNEVNTAPVLAAIANRTVTVGTLISFAAVATDADLPVNTLSFSLLAGAPTGAAIDAGSGLFTWTPDGSQSPSTNVISVRVTDNGSPALNDTRSFTVQVVNEPIIQSIVISGQTVTLTWSAISGKTYRMQYKSDLNEPKWTDVEGDVNADNTLASKNETLFAHEPRF